MSTASIRVSDASRITSCRPSPSKEWASNSPVLPYPAISRKGSLRWATDRLKRCRSRAWRNALSWIKVSSDPSAYAQPITVR